MGSPPVRPGYGEGSVQREPLPEILPPSGHSSAGGYPTAGYGPPQPPVRRPRSRWAMAPATYTLVGINCAVFVAMALQGVSPVHPTVGDLLRWGADNAGSVLNLGQWWRIVTAMFVHGGILHIGLNMWCLWNLGLLAEPLMGSFGVFAVYILTGAAGNLLSTLVNWVLYHNMDGVSGGLFGPVGVGASGAVFGIAGALIILLNSKRLPVPPHEVKALRRSVIYFAVINLVLGFGINIGSSVMGVGVAVDNMAHLGGFSSGLLFAAPMWPRIGTPRRAFNMRLRIAVSMVTGVLVLFAFYLAQLPR